MRKHFLLLFLMALLPLAGVAATAVDISSATVTIGLESNVGDYNDQQQLPVINTVKVNAVTYYASEWPQYFDVKYYRKVGSEYVAQNADQIQNAGTYAVTVVAKGATDADRGLVYTADKENENKTEFTINKIDLKITLEDGEKQYGGTDPTELDYEFVDLPDGYSVPTLTFAALPRTTGTAVSSTGYAYTFTLNDKTQTQITATNYNVIITNQPKLVIKKKVVALKYKGSAAQPSKTYGVVDINTEFAAGIKTATNYELVTTGSLVSPDNDASLTTILAGVATDGKVTYEYAYASNTESANADKDGNPFTTPAEHKVKIKIDKSVATNYEFTVTDVALTVKQAKLYTGDDAPFTFTKTETEDFTYNGSAQPVTKSLTYTENNSCLYNDADNTVTPQVTISYKYQAKSEDTPADVTEFVKAGIYTAYVKPVADGNFYVEDTYATSGLPVATFGYKINKKAMYVYVTNDAITELYSGADYTLPTSTAITFQGIIESEKTTLSTAISAVVAKTTGTTPATTVKNQGTYTIIPVIPANNALTNNYDVQTYESTFTIAPNPITITPKDMLNVVYGTAIAGRSAAKVDATTPTTVVGNVTVTKTTDDAKDIVPGDLTTVLSAYEVVVANLPYAAGSENEGAITLVKKDLDETADATIIAMLKNFAITPGTGKVTIGSGTYSIVVREKNITYGDDLKWSDFSYLTPGLPTGTKPSTVKYILTNTADDSETYSQANVDALPKNAGSYTITVDTENSDLDIDNYTTPSVAAGTLVAGTLTIAPKALTFTANQITINQLATVADLKLLATSKVKINGAVNKDKILYDVEFVSGVTGTNYSYSLALTDGKLDVNADVYVGGYKIVAPATVDASVYANANYDITWNVTGNLEVVDNLLVIDVTSDDIVNQLTAAGNSGEAHELRFENHEPWPAGTWNTMVLPFEISVAKLSAAMKAAGATEGYAIVNRMNQEKTTSSSIKFDLFMGTIPANEPFLIKTTDAIDFTNVKVSGTIDNTKLTEPSISNTTGDVTFHGLYAVKKDLSETERTVSKNNWYSKWTDFNLTAFEAYFSGCDAKNARIFVEDLDGNGVTAIKTLDMDTKTATPVDGWYTLNGVKLQGAPTEKGIYINNGKKVVIK